MENIFFTLLWVFAGAGVSAVNLWILDLMTRNILSSRGNLLLLPAGFLLRMGLCAACFYLSASGGRLTNLAVCVAAFFAARIALVKKIRDSYAGGKGV